MVGTPNIREPNKNKTKYVMKLKVLLSKKTFTAILKYALFIML